MGGLYCLAVRRSDGSEFISERHTNYIPSWSTNPDILEDGDVVTEWLGLAKKGAHHPDIPAWDTISYSEYGVLLVDFVSKQILSCQGYAEPGRFLVTAGICDGLDERILKIHQTGRLRLGRWPPRDPSLEILLFSSSETAALVGSVSEHRRRNFWPENFVLYMDWEPWVIEHTVKCGVKERERVRRFLRNHGWKTRVRGQRL